jgi:hypothetical protein
MCGVSALVGGGGEGRCVLVSLEELECSGAHFAGPALQQMADTATGTPQPHSFYFGRPYMHHRP